MLLWLALAIPPMALVVAYHGLDVGPAMLSDRLFIIEEVATLATAVTAALAAFAATIPGKKPRWLWIPAIPFAVWAATLGAGCVEDWMNLGAAGLALRWDFDCLLPMIGVGIVPVLAMVAMLRRGAPLYPRAALILGTLATAAIANFGLRLFHMGDVSIMILVWHVGAVIVLSAFAWTIAPKILRWRDAEARHIPVAKPG
jgi:hypothetical protein